MARKDVLKRRRVKSTELKKVKANVACTSIIIHSSILSVSVFLAMSPHLHIPTLSPLPCFASHRYV
jgi:hypothetical protein